PEARIQRDLLVAAAPGVDLAGHPAGALLEFADDQCVDVFIGGALVKRWVDRFLKDAVQSVDDAGALIRAQDACPLQGACEGLGAADIGLDQAAVKIERPGEALEDFRRAGLKTSTPEFHPL